LTAVGSKVDGSRGGVAAAVSVIIFTHQKV
jgi:hypothetical protein